MADLESVRTFAMRVRPYRRVDFYIAADLSEDQARALVRSVHGGVSHPDPEPVPDLALRVAAEFGLEADVYHDVLEIRASVTFWPAGTADEREAEAGRKLEELQRDIAARKQAEAD